MHCSFNVVTVVSSRYGFVGGMARQAIYRFEGIFINAFVWFSSVYAVYRFFQVVIWKRVREINEGLVMRYRIFSVLDSKSRQTDFEIAGFSSKKR